MTGQAPQEIERFLAGFPLTAGCRVEVLPGGGNNRVYRVYRGQEQWLLKEYFSHPGDQRDRLQAEYQFLEYTQHAGIRFVPLPLFCWRERRLALYEWLSGVPLTAAPAAAEVAAAAALIRELNRDRSSERAAMLAAASEACFSIADHLRCVDRRIGRLSSLIVRDNLDAEAAAFLHDRLLPAWQAVTEQVRRQAGALMDTALPKGDRCLSPSDFGFHNALCTEDGQLRFIDFEYAGWDDPAKLVCDFFHQVKIPVDPRFFECFFAEVAAVVVSREELRQRVEWLMPVYTLKWCCIVLNEFLPVSRERREFAARAEAVDRRPEQLNKARQLLARWEDTIQ